MTRVLATYNIKGGVGKTSAAVNLATLAALGGARTLLWDLDPQGASTYLFRVRPKVKGGARKLVRGKTDVDAAIKGTDTRAWTCCRPTSPTATWTSRSARPSGRRAGSRTCSRRSRGDYDYTFLDCPPSISLVSESVFEAADALLVPIIPATLSSRTLEQLHSVLDERRRPAGARLLLDGRPPQAAAPRADGQPRAGAPTCSRR